MRAGWTYSVGDISVTKYRFVRALVSPISALLGACYWAGGRTWYRGG